MLASVSRVQPNRGEGVAYSKRTHEDACADEFVLLRPKREVFIARLQEEDTVSHKQSIWVMNFAHTIDVSHEKLCAGGWDGEGQSGRLNGAPRTVCLYLQATGCSSGEKRHANCVLRDGMMKGNM